MASSQNAAEKLLTGMINKKEDYEADCDFLWVKLQLTGSVPLRILRQLTISPMSQVLTALKNSENLLNWYALRAMFGLSFGKELFTWFIVNTLGEDLCNLSYVLYVTSTVFQSDFEGRILVLIVPVPGSIFMKLIL